jgi:chromosomal replication initiation ATPase DnaA
MSSIFTIGESHEPVEMPKNSFVETLGPKPAPKKKKRKPRFNKLRSNKGFYISTTNSNLLTAAKIVAEKKGVSVVYVVGPSGWGKTRLGYEYARQIDYDVVYEKLQTEDNIDDYIKICKKLNQYITSEKGFNLGSSYELGHSYFMKISNFLCKRNYSYLKRGFF